MKERYYQLIDERLFEQLENGLPIIIIPKPHSKDICHLHYTIWFIR